MREEPMTIPNLTYTMSVKRDGGAEEVVARNVTAARALLIALEHGGAGRATIVANVGYFHTRWELLRHPPNAEPEKIMATVTVRTSDYMADFQDAVVEFEKRFLDDTPSFWAGELESDDEHARRCADKGE
jgi:hypothetical protein